jgi:hypothetical protein
MADLFKDILPSILQTKQYALLTPQDENSYPAFMVNRALSYHRDTALLANEMNKNPNIDNRMKYDFLFHIVRPMKRTYTKWHKKEDSETLEVIKEYYGYSDAKALEVLRILNNKQLEMIKSKIYKGD